MSCDFAWCAMQVNTGAAAVLYALVGAWAVPNTGAVLLDVCCGTGTIGLTLARRVRKKKAWQIMYSHCRTVLV